MALNEYTPIKENIVQEGISQWNRQREAAQQQKLEEQQKMREMLDRYWPWGSKPQPRGYKNLRLEEIFPNKDLLKAKRCVSPLRLGRPGGGAPAISNTGQKLVRTKEHPIIRFQWNQDLRRCVDNTIRYKTNKEDREQYRKQLDAQVAEKKIREKWEKENEVQFYQRAFLKSPPWGKPGPGGTVWRPPRNIGINFLKSLGWSTENTLKSIAVESDSYHNEIMKDYENFKRIATSDYHSRPHPQQIPRKECTAYDRCLNTRIESALNKRRLSPLKREKVNGEELVPLLAKQRAMPVKVPLGTTDVTRGNPQIKRPANREYLQNLTNQMDVKKQHIKDIEAADVENVRRHFEALDNFWGKPGHGAPRSTIKKGCLDRLLYNYGIYA